MYKLLRYNREKLRLKKKKRASIGKLFYRLKISGKLSRSKTPSGDELKLSVSGGGLGVPEEGREGVAGGVPGGEVRTDGHQPGPVVRV